MVSHDNLWSVETTPPILDRLQTNKKRKQEIYNEELDTEADDEEFQDRHPILKHQQLNHDDTVGYLAESNAASQQQPLSPDHVTIPIGSQLLSHNLQIAEYLHHQQPVITFLHCKDGPGCGGTTPSPCWSRRAVLPHGRQEFNYPDVSRVMTCYPGTSSR